MRQKARTPSRRRGHKLSLESVRADRRRADGRRLSQRDVALLAGMPHDRYWRIESGYRVATPADRKAIAKALRKPVSRLQFDITAAVERKSA